MRLYKCGLLIVMRVLLKWLFRASLCVFWQEAGILSPVQDGNLKPQIDSNKANNYNIVKDVGAAVVEHVQFFHEYKGSTVNIL